MPIVPARPQRDWMAQHDGFAARCLPMVVANQAGWWILNSHNLRVAWDGADDQAALMLEWDGEGPWPASSHFGFGILTWQIPYLFRTPPGIQLAVRGPANQPKDGAVALEGIVETEWATATFTMNWQLTRKLHPVYFAAGEPICQIVPLRLADVEMLAPALHQMPFGLGKDHWTWSTSRDEYNARIYSGELGSKDWQKHYMRGVSPAGAVATEHRTSLRVQPFAPEPARDRWIGFGWEKPSMSEQSDA